MLTSEQLLAIKNNIAADQVLSAIPSTPDGAAAIAEIYNLPAAPDFIVWKSLLKELEITGHTSPEGTSWSWVTYKGQSVSEQNCWARMFNGTYSVNPSLPNVRLAFTDIFSGAGASQVAQRTHLLAMSKRKATRLERLLSTGIGTLATPATMGYEGNVTYQDIEQARAS